LEIFYRRASSAYLFENFFTDPKGSELVNSIKFIANK